MTLEGITLEDWLSTPPADSIKRGGDSFPFSGKYQTFKNYLENNLHKEVTKQAIYREIQQSASPDGIIWLNDHGPEHIKTVIERATQLLSSDIKLNVREVFLLLNAIQVHDVGNFYGRHGHEKKVRQAIGEGLTPILFDRTEVNYIERIAQVHGGKIKYKDGTEDKNTISSIKPNVVSDGYDIKLHLLAAILRFADELADDKNRADVKSLREGTMPKGSEIFHAYAACLDTVKIDHQKQTIELHFKIPKDFVTKKFGKIKPDKSIEEKFLLDEIYDRALKMHNERIYCGKFWKKHIDLDKIWVQIEFYSNATSDETFVEEDLYMHDDITFTLHDNQYPEVIDNIFKLCPTELTYPNGAIINGENLLKKINKEI